MRDGNRLFTNRLIEKQMKKISIFITLLFTLFLWNCENVKEWSDLTDNVNPGIVTNTRVENINGGAVIYYNLPSDNDLLAVKAMYSFQENGEIREAFSSAFNDSIKLEGFPDTEEHTVYLYVVDKSKNESEPVEVKINPLDPPVEIIRESLLLNATFGGVYTYWENNTEDEVSLTLYVKNDMGDYEYHDAYYSKMEKGNYIFRELGSDPKELRIEIRDKWGNYSTPVDTIITPLFEEEIIGRGQSGYIWQRWGFDDKTCIYRGDVARQEGSRDFYLVHDGDAWNNSNWWHTPAISLTDYIDWPESNYIVSPMYFIIDMVKMASYSRFRYFMRSRTPIFSAQTFTSLEVWGTNNPKALEEIGDGSKEDNLKYWTEWEEVGGTGEWRNDWTKMTDFVLELPSGANTPGLLTSEDEEFVKAGFEVLIDPQFADTPFRYLRFVIRESREPNGQIQVTELKFWGAYKD